MNECINATYLIEAEWSLGAAVFIVVVAVAYLSRKIKDHPKVTPAYKVGDKKHG